MAPQPTSCAATSLSGTHGDLALTVYALLWLLVMVGFEAWTLTA